MYLLWINISCSSSSSTFRRVEGLHFLDGNCECSLKNIFLLIRRKSPHGKLRCTHGKIWNTILIAHCILRYFAIHTHIFFHTYITHNAFDNIISAFFLTFIFSCSFKKWLLYPYVLEVPRLPRTQPHLQCELYYRMKHIRGELTQRTTINICICVLQFFYSLVYTRLVYLWEFYIW